MELRSIAVYSGIVAGFLVFTFYASFYATSAAWHPCNEALVADHPSARLEFDSRNGEAVTITHAGGDTLAVSNEEALLIRYTDSETGEVTEITWLNDSTGEQVGLGDEITLQQQQLENVSITSGDLIRVVWQQRERGIPPICPNYTPIDTATLGLHTVGNGTDSSGT